ncbi:putative type II secretory pathway, pseudopilin EpsG [Photobacterium profundum SS9]|uniref:Type II secretion system core protein G n=2 Tax=Photobacterium profundum TaxID=74109 RepID=Q6LLS9_PHOPR|nr:putative type II secretory pathway, pseudopilin EpsG [Photobacterium profundum SS9]
MVCSFSFGGFFMQRKQRGFTLLEVMVVIVILGVLASLVVPNLLGNKEKADQQKAVTDISALEQSLDMYKLDNSVYPTTDQGLEALVSMPSSSPEPRNYRDGGYIRRLPNDPWGYEYQYVMPGEHGPIDIFSLGADGQEGGEGNNTDIGNWNMLDF